MNKVTHLPRYQSTTLNNVFVAKGNINFASTQSECMSSFDSSSTVQKRLINCFEILVRKAPQIHSESIICFTS